MYYLLISDIRTAFFMRKGADCLSKWVGEAERQLRLLFEEAKNSQPSIIFFDEIDGLAPVRSSKQDQIHASIVSTLLALMDGMDGRGQVVVIGATNRPDAIDPALRRPGRFDREFYFPLPGLDAREKILSIMTRGWLGWSSDDGDEQGKERLKGLAKLTKGYGGADLRVSWLNCWGLFGLGKLNNYVFVRLYAPRQLLMLFREGTLRSTSRLSDCC
jgi:SpoVK/Ycf46/Vps4 family AAA+-type ATPase